MLVGAAKAALTFCSEAKMATWYVRTDGTICDPDEVEVMPNGMIRAKAGADIAYGPHGPRSRGVTDDDIAAYRTRDLQPAAPRQYKTRQAR